MADIARLSLQIDVNGAKRAEQALKGLQNGSIRAQQATDRLQSTVRRSGGAFRLQRGAIQQAGFQIGDFATQVAAGQSAMVAFSQQGSQLAGIMGPGGAVLGAVIAIGGAIAGGLVRSMGQGEDAAEKYASTLEYLDTVMESTGRGAFELTERIRDLYAVSQTAAELEIRRALVESAAAFNAASDELQETVSDRFDTTILGDIEPAISQAARLARLGIDVTEAFNEFGGSRGASFREGINLIRDEAENLNEEFGISVTSARSLIGALGRAQFDPSIESMRALQEALFDAQDSSSAVSGEFTTLSSRLANIAQSAVEAAQRGETLEQWAKDLKAALQETDPALEDMRSALDSLISGLEGEYLALTLTDEQLLNHRLSVVGATDDERQRAMGLYATIRALENKQEAEREAARLAEETARAEQRATEQLERRTQALLNQSNPLAKFAQDWATVQEALAAGIIDESQAQMIMDSLVGAGEKSGEKSAKAFENPWQDTANSVAQSLQDAIASGDWDSLGEGIGNALAASMSAIVSDTITESLSKNLTANSSAISQIGAAFAGPVAGAVVGGLTQLAVAELSDWLGSSDWDPTEARQAMQGTGTILGSIDAKSESIANATDSISSTNEELVNINTGMLRSLQNLQAGISGAVSMVLRQNGSGVTPRLSGNQDAGDFLGGAAPILGETADLAADFFDGAIEMFTLGLVDGFVGDALGSVFGGGQKVVDRGVRILGGNLSDLVNETLVQAYATIKEDGGWFGSDKRFDRFQSIATNQFSLAFESIYDSVEAGASALGILPSDVQSRLDAFVVETQRISLEGLNADEQQAEIEAVFSTIFDDLSGSVVPFLDLVQDAGEGLGETLARAATQVQVMEEAILALGLTSSDASPALQTLASDALADLFGGADKMAASLTGFESNFLSAAEQFTTNGRRLRQAMGDLPLPETREGFLALARAQDIYTQEGRENIATLLRLQGAADEYYDHLESGAEDAFGALESAVSGAIATLQSEMDRLRQAVQDASGGTDSALNDLARLVDEQKRADQERLQTQLDANQAMQDAEQERVQAQLEANQRAQRSSRDVIREIDQELRGVSRALSGLTEDVLGSETARTQAMQTLRGALTTGSLDGAGDAAATAANIDATQFRTSVDFARQQGITAALLSDVEAIGQGQLSTAERQLAALESSEQAIRAASEKVIAELQADAERLNQAFENEQAALDALLENARDQVEEIRGNGEKSASVNEALARLRESIESEADARASLEQGNHQEQIDSLTALLDQEREQYNALLGIDASVMSVEAALAAFNAELARQNQPTPAPASPTNQPGEFVSAEQNYLQANRDVLNAFEGRAPDGARFSGEDIQRVISKNGIRTAEEFAAWHWQNYGQAEGRDGFEATVPGFASGGMHAGGLRIVGERGPELEMTGPSRIMNNSDLMRAMSGGELVPMMKKLIESIESGNYAIARSTAKTAKQLERWEFAGLPQERTFV